jgi:hypothetical protein
MNKILPKYSAYRQLDDKEVRDLCKEYGAFVPQTEGEYAGKLVFTPPNAKWHKPIVVDPATCQGDAETAMFNSVRKFVNHAVKYRKTLTMNVIRALKRGQKTGNS